MTRSIQAVLAFTAVCAASSALPATLRAQGTFDAACTAASASAQLREFCMRVGQGIEIIQPRLGIALSGGNPVPGTASTLGLRLGSMPRISLAARISAALVDTPPIDELQGSEDLRFPLPAFGLDASVGVFSGVSLAPTIGGFGSIDLLGSIGMVPLPQGEGFAAERPVSWAVGARAGLLRESFTAPGISVSGMYRHIGSVSYGDSVFDRRDAWFVVEDASALSFRGAISKRIPLVGLGFTAGAGYDKYSATAAFAVRDPSLLTGTTIRVPAQELESDRMSYFANVSWTLVLIHFVGEIGVQDGMNDPPASVVGNELLRKGGIFGGFAVRIAL